VLSVKNNFLSLLKNHNWTEPLTVTEGKDQLGQQDGELARLTAETAQQIIKEIHLMGNKKLKQQNYAKHIPIMA